MPKSNEVAIELRKLADALDRNPDAQISKPTIYFSHSYLGAKGKDMFLALAKSMPRPIKKDDGYRHDEVVLCHDTDALDIYSSIPKDRTCILIRPAQEAVYECDPILSQLEESTLEVQQ
jgi:hypothetical protein